MTTQPSNSNSTTYDQLEAILEQADALQDGQSSDEDLEARTVGECILNISQLPEELQIVVENSLDEPFAPFLPSIEEFGSDAERYLDPECL